jgi:glycosyltransferase involved in cell wall biosynthesis
MTTVPAVEAGRALGIPVVATVRDYWPVCYWSDLIHDPTQSALCPACSSSMMRRCTQPRAGALAPLTWPLIPYMRANLARKRRTLARASAVIAVSSVIAHDLRTRAPELSATSLRTIPNPIDMTALDRAYDTTRAPLSGPYLLYAGKLALNKGTHFLLPAVKRAGITWPVVIVGDGPMRLDLERDAQAAGLDVRILGWQERDDVWAWMRHATALAFPSYGPESLSRVLIEAAALGVPIAAMATGGTTDILTHEHSALLSTTAVGLGDDLAHLAASTDLRAALGTAARRDAHDRFAATSVVARVEAVYRELIDETDR